MEVGCVNLPSCTPATGSGTPSFRERRGIYRLTDPLIRLHELVIGPDERLLVRGRGAQVWAVNADTVAAKIYGPHLEDLAREWCLSHADSTTLGGTAHDVLPATIACREHRQGHELDVVVVETSAGTRPRVTAIGEVKATTRPIDAPDHSSGSHPGSPAGILGGNAPTIAGVLPCRVHRRRPPDGNKPDRRRTRRP